MMWLWLIPAGWVLLVISAVVASFRPVRDQSSPDRQQPPQENVAVGWLYAHVRCRDHLRDTGSVGGLCDWCRRLLWGQHEDDQPLELPANFRPPITPPPAAVPLPVEPGLLADTAALQADRDQLEQDSIRAVGWPDVPARIRQRRARESDRWRWATGPTDDQLRRIADGLGRDNDGRGA